MSLLAGDYLPRALSPHLHAAVCLLGNYQQCIRRCYAVGSELRQGINGRQLRATVIGPQTANQHINTRLTRPRNPTKSRDRQALHVRIGVGDELGANVVRIHLQLGKFMTTPEQPDSKSLKQLARLVELVEERGLYLDLTGLGCYPGVYTADHFANVSQLELDPAFADYMAEAFKPLGVYLNFYQPKLSPEGPIFRALAFISAAGLL